MGSTEREPAAAAEPASTPEWWAVVSRAFGAMLAEQFDHPASELRQALNGNYIPHQGETGTGIAQWVQDHTPVEPDPRSPGSP